jgi:hypothetical protein
MRNLRITVGRRALERAAGAHGVKVVERGEPGWETREADVEAAPEGEAVGVTHRTLAGALFLSLLAAGGAA